jgi:hypothetical protein
MAMKNLKVRLSPLGGSVFEGTRVLARNPKRCQTQGAEHGSQDRRDLGDDDTATNKRAATIERDTTILPRFGALVRR